MFSKNYSSDYVEREIIASIFFRNEIIDFLQIKPKYFMNKINEKILEEQIECYKKHKVVDLPLMTGMNTGELLDTYVDICTNDMYYLNDWERQLKMAQELVLSKYKEKVIKDLFKELEQGKITYEDYQSKMDKIGKIQITSTNDNRMKTINDIDTSYEEKTYIKSGCIQLDKKMKGFALSQLSVWSGSNASAKSTYLNQIALESIKQGYKVGIFSGELTDRDLLSWITLNAAGKDNIKLNEEKGYYYVYSTKKEKILKWLNGKLFIYDNEFGNDAREILQSVENCVKKNDVKVLILDNLMAMNLSKFGDQKYDMQTRLITELSAMAKRLNVHIHFVCHPRKSTAFLRKIDISGSADLTNIANNVLIMHRVNSDFKKSFKEWAGLKEGEDHPIFHYSNAIEICKNRDFGIQDEMIGLYFEQGSKRMLNNQGEDKKYGWEYLD